MKRISLGLILLVWGAGIGCTSKPETSQGTGTQSGGNEKGLAKTGFLLRSPAFGHMQTIPAAHLHRDEGGKNESPPLEWTDPPAGTQAFVLICVDPDAPGGDFVHWVVYNIPAEVRKLEGNLGRAEKLPNGALQGKNDFGEIGYDGPAPPPGKPHRYFFRLYAIKSLLNLPPGATREQVEKALQGLVLAQAELVGQYEHKK